MRHLVSELAGCKGAARMQHRHCDPDISPKLSLGSFLRASHQVARGDPQKYGREGQNDRDTGNDPFAILLYEMPGTIPVLEDSREESGKTFFGISARYILMSLLHAVLKGVSPSYNPNRNTNSDKKPAASRATTYA